MLLEQLYYMFNNKCPKGGYHSVFSPFKLNLSKKIKDLQFVHIVELM